MKKLIIWSIAITSCVLFTPHTIAAENSAITIYLTGDSTTQYYEISEYPREGWGQNFQKFFDDNVIVDNCAVGGSTIESFMEKGYLNNILQRADSNDYVFIQFGYNDNDPGPGHVSIDEYGTYLVRYIDMIEECGATPVILSPNNLGFWWEDGKCFQESLSEYANECERVAETENVIFIDAGHLEFVKWNEMAGSGPNSSDTTELHPEIVQSMYNYCEDLESSFTPYAHTDYVHFKHSGAAAVAEIIAEEIRSKIPNLAEHMVTYKFIDIENHWAKDNIELIQELGLIDGVDNRNFSPEKPVTKAEYLKMIMNALGIPGHAFREGECLDATAYDWFGPYLQGALDKNLIPDGMINDLSIRQETKILKEETANAEQIDITLNIYSGSYNGNHEITREEVMALTAQCLKNSNIVDTFPDVELDFDDIMDVSESYIQSVEECVSIGIIEGDGGSLNPDAYLTRAEAATIMSRILDL